MLSGSYDIPNVRAKGQLVYTNNAWGGAARGAGPPQVNFALESAMELLAAKLGMDPLEFRALNSLKPGGSISTGQVIDEWPYLDAWKLLGLIIKELFGKRHRTKMPGAGVASELPEVALVLAEAGRIDQMWR